MNYTIGSSVFNDYKITKLLGQGSYGKVFEIERVDFGVSYKSALKVISIPSNNSEIESLRMEGMSDVEIRDYFSSVVEDLTKEFSIMYKLKGNSNIVNYDYHKVIDYDDHIGFDVLIQMELLTPVLTYAHNHPFTIKDVIKLGIDISKALEICVKYNIIHRDIKPENIFVSDLGDFKLGDFGVARSMEKTTSILSKKGTYSYMAPEAYRGDNYTYSVDIYSLGIVLYRLLNNNRTPFLPEYPTPITYKNREESLVKRMSGEPLNPPAYGSDRLKDIILKACAYKPEDRYSSPSALRKDLEEILYSEAESSVIYPSGDELSLHTNQYVSNTTSNKQEVTQEDKTELIFSNKKESSEPKDKKASLNTTTVQEDTEEDKTALIFNNKEIKKQEPPQPQQENKQQQDKTELIFSNKKESSEPKDKKASLNTTTVQEDTEEDKTALIFNNKEIKKQEPPRPQQENKQQQDKTKDNKTQENKQKKNKTPFVIAIIAIIIGIGIGGYILLNNNNSLNSGNLNQYNTGMKYLEDGDYEQAITCFNAAIKSDDKQVQNYTGLYNAYLANGQDEEAQEVLDIIIEEFSEEDTDDIDYNDTESIKNKVITGTYENGYPYIFIYDDEGRLSQYIELIQETGNLEKDMELNVRLLVTYHYNDDDEITWIETVNDNQCEEGYGNNVFYYENNLLVKRISYYANGDIDTAYYENEVINYSEYVNADGSYKLLYYTDGHTERSESYNSEGKLQDISYYVNGKYDHSESFE